MTQISTCLHENKQPRQSLRGLGSYSHPSMSAGRRPLEENMGGTNCELSRCEAVAELLERPLQKGEGELVYS